MNKKIIIEIVAIIVIIAVAIGVIFMINSNNNSGNNNTAKENVVNTENENSHKTNIVENEATTTNTPEENEQEIANTGKTLIAYFSLPETTGDAKEDSTVTVNGENLGNTQYVANLIQEHTGADIFRIEAVKQYNTSDHQELIADAQEEQRIDSRPEIKNKISNFEDYDTIFIGYPIWWSDLPQILYTFLESYDFTGKKVYLFSTNGGRGLADTFSTITSKLNTANVNSNAFKLYRDNMEDAPKEVEKWLREIEVI